MIDTRREGPYFCGNLTRRKVEMGALGDAVAARDRRDRSENDDELLVGAARAHLFERLSAGFVHEARNPLNAMAIHLEVLADKLRDAETGELPPQLARNLDAARNQVRRLDDLLRRWGEFSCERSDVEDLAACVRRAAGLCEYHVRRAGLELSVEVERGLAVERAGLVCQALTELLLLSARRAAPGSTIRLAAAGHEDDLSVSFRGEGAEDVATKEGEDPAVEAVRAIARRLGGELTHASGPTWGWSLRLPRAAAPHSIVA